MIEKDGADRKQANLADPRMISPLHLSRINRKTDMNAKFKQDDNEDDIEIDGFRIPKELNSVWAVSKVLNQTKGKVKLKELAKNSSVNQNLSVQHKVRFHLSTCTSNKPYLRPWYFAFWLGKNISPKSIGTRGRRTKKPVEMASEARRKLH
jgi:hypothetical protein